MNSETRKQRKRDQQRQEIVAAARELFLREGYERFSMRKLARALGCVPGTLYLYFKDKNALIACLVEESFELLMNDLEASATDASPLAVVKEIMRAYIAFGRANPNHYQFAFMLQRTKPLEEARPRPHRSYAMLRSHVAACIDQGIFRPVDVELATQRVWTGIHGVTSLMITMPNFPWGNKDHVIDDVTGSIIAGLLSPESAPADVEGGSDDD